MANSVVNLDSEKEIVEFLDTESKTTWKNDMKVGDGIYSGLSEDNSTWKPKNVDHNIAEIGYNTRAIAFFFDKDEYKDEMKDWSHASIHLAQR
jgi:hypothetical protein